MANNNFSSKPLTHSKDIMQILSETKAQISEVDIEQMRSWQQGSLKSSNNFHLIDVRETPEFEQGYIPGAIHIGRGVLDLKIANVIPDKSELIVLYCGSGVRSAFAALRLQQLGYTNVYSMLLGIKGWFGLGLPIDN